ncbi:hypothetical protein L6164_018318 [Bauhinia variegata]|uniref:Uncharacterized protein n=1 Tax=Bauhinia variegata TaxID=167791 RepID=A0ACB9NEB1_BAUVA|nr:hypothetical protein L6164_018318 [Bauhinia variegata]
MAMARLLGGSTPRFLVQFLSIKPHQAEALTIIRCRGAGPQKSKSDSGRGSQTNGAGTMSVGEKPVASNPKGNSSGNGNQVNGNTVKRSG